MKLNHMNIKWDEITLSHVNYLDECLKIYDQVFPIEVREPHDIFLKSLRYGEEGKPNNFRFLIGMEGEKIISFATKLICEK